MMKSQYSDLAPHSIKVGRLASRCHQGRLDASRPLQDAVQSDPLFVAFPFPGNLFDKRIAPRGLKHLQAKARIATGFGKSSANY